MVELVDTQGPERDIDGNTVSRTGSNPVLTTIKIGCPNPIRLNIETFVNRNDD